MSRIVNHGSTATMAASPDANSLAPEIDLAAKEAVAAGLREDLWRQDVTTLWTVRSELTCTAELIARANGVIAGLPVLVQVLGHVDAAVTVTLLSRDGDRVEVGQVVARLSGPARSVITSERTALNLLQRMSGIATLAARYVAAVEGTDVTILDTRKTAPGLRALDKYAVTCGGASNHRRSLAAMVLIKENHVTAAGGVVQAIEAARTGMGHSGEHLQLEVEVTDHAEAIEALACSVDWVLLDNMEPTELAAVARARDAMPASPRPRLEASGNMSLDAVASVAGTGVDAISVGALTHSAPALDLSLLVRPGRG